MKYIYIIITFSIFISCKENKNLNDESIVSLFKDIFYSKSIEEKGKVVGLLNDKILKSKSYYYKIIISDSLRNGIDYSFKMLNNTYTTPDINSLSVCYKSKDSLLINNLVERQDNLNKYLENISLDREEIFIEFSIESSKSGHMDIVEWENAMKLLKTILKSITEKQIINKTEKPFRMLFYVKGDCYLQPGPPPQ